MAISGWFVALLVAGVIPLAIVGEPWVLAAWFGLVALLPRST